MRTSTGTDVDLHPVDFTHPGPGFPGSLPEVVHALRHSRVVAAYGRGTERVEIHKVQGSPL